VLAVTVRLARADPLAGLAPDDVPRVVVRSALVDSDSLTVDFVERAPIERLDEPFDSLRVDSTG
jgi:hypothetical protein